MSLFVKRNFFRKLGHEVRSLGSWSNKAHLAFQDVPELRNLIHANLADDAADASSACVAFTCPNRSVLFGVSSHRTKFCKHKRATVLSDSVLLVKNRSARFQLDEQRSHEHNRQRKNCANESHEPVNNRAREFSSFRLASTT